MGVTSASRIPRLPQTTLDVAFPVRGVPAARRRPRIRDSSTTPSLRSPRAWPASPRMFQTAGSPVATQGERARQPQAAPTPPRVGPKASAVPHRGFSFRARAPDAPTRVAAARDKRAAPAPRLIYTAPRPASRSPQRGRGQPVRGRGQRAPGLGALSTSWLPGAPPFSARAPFPLRSRVGGGRPQLPVASFPDGCLFLVPRSLLLTPQEGRGEQRGRTWGFVECVCGVGLWVCGRARALCCSAARWRHPTRVASSLLRLPLQSLLVSIFLWLVLLKTSCFGHYLRAEVGARNPGRAPLFLFSVAF